MSATRARPDSCAPAVTMPPEGNSRRPPAKINSNNSPSQNVGTDQNTSAIAVWLWSNQPPRRHAAF